MRTRITIACGALLLVGPAAPAGGWLPAPFLRAAAPGALQESADSTWRAARNALNAGDYRRAADLFREVERGEGDPALAADALYYRALSLSRLGGKSNLSEALADLERQAQRYPDAATRGDAGALSTRIAGELARLGDAEAARSVARQARQIEEEQARLSRETRQLEAAERGLDVAEDQLDRMRAQVAGEEDVRLAALNALLQMDAERAVPILKQVLARRDPGSEGLRRHAVFLASQKRTPETVEILLEAARGDPDQEVKQEAVFWLSQVGDERAVDALQGILAAPGAAALHGNAIFALSQHRSPRAGEILRDYAARADVDPDVRKEAIFWLGQRKSPENLAFLRELFGRVEDEEVRQSVLFAVSQLGAEESGRWLLEVALDESESVEIRKEALFWAGQAGVPFDDLDGVYGRVSNREIRRQLLFVFSQSREPAAVERLIEIARGETDPELRQEAIFWLGQSDDPRAEELLLELITR